MLLPLTALILALVGSSIGQVTRITSTKGPLFIDELGRSRIFRGTNVVYKAFPYVPQTTANANPVLSFNQADVDVLAAHGVSAIRLGVLWAGVEPTKGNYNQTYLAELTKIVQMCSDAGIYVLLDFHQDLMSERFCGQGVPPYIVDTNPTANSGAAGFPFPLSFSSYKTGSNGNPSNADCQSKIWSLYSTSQSLAVLFDQLYNNKNGVRDAFISFWTVVAKTFLPFKNILGYDIINEPLPGDIYGNSALLDVLTANRVNVQPFYDVVSTAIRDVDPNAIIHFESIPLIQKEVGFTKAPGDAQYSSKSVLNFHYYDTVQSKLNVSEAMGFRINSAKTLNCGVFMGEFEMGYGSGGSTLPSILTTFQAADTYLLSAVGWEYKDYVPDNALVMTGTNNGLVDPTNMSVRQDFATVFARPYAHTIAGTPTSMQFIDTTSVFTLDFAFNGQPDAAGLTEVRGRFDLFFKNGFNVKVTSSSGAFGVLVGDSKGGSNSVTVGPCLNNAPQSGAQVRVTIAPKDASDSSSPSCPISTTLALPGPSGATVSATTTTKTSGSTAPHCLSIRIIALLLALAIFIS
ncbi:glycoside hydrolase [Rhizoclosmatium globosum]|uniref:Glycoside hydrolase n=1 Tax=Rhizoclosmatium globosum TaxID=329046 RepID=A0A1Y2C7W8_9FUNG|nr:glycoside hydrolase [Rhizoclosmatium globosum]|eukprot:ORY43119.1 glycoside hydrolase [Rhizoclosmatium globosum]